MDNRDILLYIMGAGFLISIGFAAYLAYLRFG